MSSDERADKKPYANNDRYMEVEVHMDGFMVMLACCRAGIALPIPGHYRVNGRVSPSSFGYWYHEGDKFPRIIEEVNKDCYTPEQRKVFWSHFGVEFDEGRES